MIMGRKNIQSKVVRRQSQKIPRARKKNKEQKPLRRWIFVIGVGFFCGVVIYLGTCSPIISIKKIIITGTQRVDATRIEDDVRTLLSGQLFGCIRNDNFFFLSENRIRETIFNDPRVKNVQLKRIFPDTVSIDIVEYDHIIVWCTDVEQKNCFHVSDGCAIASVALKDPVIMQNPHTKIVGDKYDDVAIGECFMSSADMDSLLYLGRELTYALDVGIVQPYISSTRGSREARYDTDEGWYILADLSYDVQDTIVAASLFKKRVSLPSFRSDLAYIDLRFPERIFYKMKDGVIIEDENVDGDEYTDIDNENNKEAHD
jgi:hypothetical protein